MGKASGWSLYCVLALGASVVVGTRVPSLAGDDTKGGVAPVGSVTGTRPRFEDAITPEERKRAAEVANPTGPFAPEGIWLPPIYLQNASGSVTWAGLLYLQVKDFEAGTRTTVLPPFYLSRADADTRTIVSPLYGRREDYDGAAGYIAAYAWRRDRLADSDVVFPFYWSFRERDFEDGPVARESGAFAPFYFWQSDTSGKHRELGPPLFWRWGDANETTTILGNVYWHSEPGRETRSVFPFYFGGSTEEGSSYDVAPPLLFFRTAEADRSTLLALNTIYTSRPSGYTLASVPFVFAGKDGLDHYTCVPPLLFFHAGDGTTENTLVANTFWSKGPDAWSFDFLPLVFAGGQGDDQHVFVPPLFWEWGDKESSSWIAGPLYHHADGEGNATTIGFPLLWDFESKDRSTWVAGPVYHHKDPSGSTTGVLPFYLGGRHGDDAYDVIPPALAFHTERPGGSTTVAFPWLWRTTDGETSTTVAGPVFHHEEPGASSTGVLPLAIWGDHGESSWQVIPPLLTAHYTKPGASTWATIPLFWRATDEDSTNTGVLPFYFGGEDKERSYDVVPPLLAWHYAAKDRSDLIALPWLWNFRRGESTTTVAGPFYRHEEPGSSATGVVPIWFEGKDEKAETRYDVFPSLLTWYDSSPGRSTFASLPLLTYHHEEDGVSKTLAANTYIRLGPDGWAFTFAPLVWAGGDAEESHVIGLPLVWSFTSPGSFRLAVLPLFDYADDAERRRFVSPFVFHHENHQDGSSATVVLGLYWGLESKERRDRIIFPLWWDLQNKAADTELMTAFPLYWSWRTGTDTTSVFLNTAWTSDKTDKGASWSFHVFPLVDVSSDEPDDLRWQVLGGVFGHETRGDAARWRIFWHWTEGT